MMIHSSRKRYVIATIFFTSAFWLTIELILLSYTNRLNVDIARALPDETQLYLRNENRAKSPLADMLPIDDFRSSYVTLIPPNPHGAGENGEAVYIDGNDKAQLAKEKEGYKKYSFNNLASSKISLERTIPDNRPQE